MNHALLMRVIHSIADLGKQRETVAEVEMVPGAVVGDCAPAHKLHREKGLLCRWHASRRASIAWLDLRHAGFIDAGDARVLKLSENLGFVFEAAQQTARRHPGPDDLERNG